MDVATVESHIKPVKTWSNLATIVYKRTYARKDFGHLENWDETVERAIMGNVRGFEVPETEIKELLRLTKERKAGPAGRGLWFSGAPAHKRIGGAALCNCWFLNASNWEHFVIAQDLLMLGGGVGLSVEHKFTNLLPKVKRDVVVEHKATKDADFIVPDSREGWCELTRRVLESFFVTGKSFSYSTICLRGSGEPIKGFGGIASGPLPMQKFINNLCHILQSREGRQIRPIDAADILCAEGEMVVAGNVRRSAIIILGDCWDKEYLRAKRWDLGVLPTYRACANFSIVCDDIEDVHPSFWKTYEIGESFGIFNRTNAQKYGRMGELRKDNCEGLNPCGEATLENGEACNLYEQALCNFDDEHEFYESCRLALRYTKRVSLEKYHHKVSEEVIKRNLRVGIGITGILNSPLYTQSVLDTGYKVIQEEDTKYSKELGVPRSIRTTVVKPSGTRSKTMDCMGYEGCHVPPSRYYIQRIRFAANDLLIPQLKQAGHYMEPVVRFDGTFDPGTLVVDFYEKAPDGYPVADEDWDTWKQLEVVKNLQSWWADQSVSVTVYYNRDKIQQLKEWLRDNLQYIKSISFLCATDHGFKQAQIGRAHV